MTDEVFRAISPTADDGINDPWEPVAVGLATANCLDGLLN
ncbi:MAG: hypothetical protein JWM91_2350 [Rhodospirillales bacterium]|nr:hypothetical protein [Rhodospirillales bacterium]